CQRTATRAVLLSVPFSFCGCRAPRDLHSFPTRRSSDLGTIELTEVHDDHDGPTGLPSLTSELEIRGVAEGEGEDAAPGTTVARAEAAPPFRVLHVTASGALTMSGVAVENGRPGGGSSGAGMYLAVSATLTSVAFAGNTTLGADGGGLAVVGGVVALENVDFTGNVVGPDDGGFSGAAIHLAGSTITEYWGGTLTGNRGSF